MRDVTLLFLRRQGELLLAMKKRGFGEGKWNGVGGKLEPGETIEQATARECREEIGVTPHAMQPAGVIEFFMSHDPAFGHRAHIFTTYAWDSEPVETEEMRPQWFAETTIPYDHMWSDDIHWLPLLLANTPFVGTITLGPHDEIEHIDLRKTA
jgi:8-oxo-dGTP diphosphatase